MSSPGHWTRRLRSCVTVTCLSVHAKKKRPADPKQLAKSIVDEATLDSKPGAPEFGPSTYLNKNAAVVAFGRLLGKKGGLPRARRLSREWRSEIAKKAA